MIFLLRGYQQAVKDKILTLWLQGVAYVLAVLPTGAGKTVLFAAILREHAGASVAIAHRQELVSQISLALARNEIPHRIIGPQKVIKLCVNAHMEDIGTSYHVPNAKCGVAGVDTLVRRGDELEAWAKSVTLCVQDEAHHVQKNNKWGTAFGMFPNAKGLGVTATPERADGRGLGRDNDGLFDAMVVGPEMRELIDQGFLTDYRVFAPPSDFMRPEGVGSTGDFSQAKNTKAVRNSQIVGDVVKHYLRIAPGKLGVTFTESVDTANDIAAQFNAAGVPAAVVSAKTPDSERSAILKRFKRRELLQLVNVDLFGEGFDLPAIEVVSMARATESYGLYVQQFGRALRLLDGKEYALIIDHVGNVVRHGLPDARRTWTLDRRERRSASKPDDTIPVKACVECSAVYERFHAACPFCGHYEPPAVRSAPEHVDGDLVELDAATLAAMRAAVEDIDRDPEEYRAELVAKRAPVIGQMAGVSRHVKNQEAQAELREAIGWWAGYQNALGRTDRSEKDRRFYFAFGVDVLTAKALKAKDAAALMDKINAKNVVLAVDASVNK